MEKSMFPHKLTLGNSTLQASRIGFGCCPMGGHGWGKSTKQEFINAVHCALELGINFFDTADIYGLGESEIILGTSLKKRRDQAIIATKFGVRRNQEYSYYDNSIQWIKIAIDDSLKRLNTDYIDLYQVHYWDNKTPLDEIFSTLEELKAKGKIKNYGITNINPLDLDDIYLKNMATFSFEFSLLNKNNEEIIKKSHKHSSLSFLSWGSLAQGMLSGKYDINSTFEKGDRRTDTRYINFHGENKTKNLCFIEQFKKFQQEYYPNVTLTQIALRWILDYLPFSVTLVGIKRPEQIIEAAKTLTWELQPIHVKYLTELNPLTMEV